MTDEKEHQEQLTDVAAYLQQIAKVPLLTRPQEVEYATAIREGRRSIVRTFLASAAAKDAFTSKVAELAGTTPDDETEEEERIRLDLADEEKAALALAQVNSTLFVRAVEEARPLLDEPERQLVVAATRAVDVARQKLAQANLRLVVSIAKAYASVGMPFMDLVSEGNLGLIRAVDKFDPARGKFSTVATWWVRQAIIRSLSNKLRTIRIPVHMVDAMNRAIRVLTGKLGRHPKPAELLAELKMPNMTEGQVRDVLSIMAGPLSLDEPVGNGEMASGEKGELQTLGSTFEDLDPRADEQLEDRDLRERILAILRVELEPREEKPLRLKVGM